MSIIRAPRPESNFYLLDKAISEDSRLTWAARGLLVFLLGKPDNWRVSVAHLRAQTAGSAKPTGRDGVYALLDELIAAGYVKRSQSRAEGGKMGEIQYLVSEIPASNDRRPPEPLPAEPDTAKPLPAEPDTAKPLPATTTLTSTELLTRIDSEARTEKSIPAPSFAGAGGEVLVGEVITEKQGSPRIELPADMPGPKDQSAKTFRAWANYAMAYRKRYNIWPAWNAKAGANLSSLIDRIGADDAPRVAAFYVCINDARLIRECHPLGILLSGCEGYRTQYLTGRQINGVTAQQLERKQANFEAGEEAARRIMARREEAKKNEFL
jgi:hypothetical protein